MAISAQQIKTFARECGFELAGIAEAVPPVDYERFDHWRSSGMAGEMTYLTDHRGTLRSDPRALLPSAKSVICVGKLYNTEVAEESEEGAFEGYISRYARGEDYHVVLRRGLTQLAEKIGKAHGEPLESRVCVDTAPLLERSFARAAGLGWIGKNTCLINQEQGSWFFLGELLISIAIAPDQPPADRCGSCRRCLDTCPTSAIVPNDEGGFSVDSRLCISYLTIELRGELPPELAAQMGAHVFGCDICQEVCPWNWRAPVTSDPAFEQAEHSNALAELAFYSEEEFALRFRFSPVWRAKYAGFLRNVAAAIGNSGNPELREPLQQLITSKDLNVATAARDALQRLCPGSAI